MRTIKVFQSGNSQAVRLPKDFQCNSEEVESFKRNDALIIQKIPQHLVRAFELLSKLADDFPEKLQDLFPQEREPY